MNNNFSLRNKYVLAFNATGIPNYKVDGYVTPYLWFMSNLIEEDSLIHGNNIVDMMDTMMSLPDCRFVYVHDLDFSITFIEEFLLYKGYKFTNNSTLNRQATNEYTVLRTQTNEVFGCTVFFPNGHKVQFIDSLKLFPQDITSLANMVGYGDYVIPNNDKNKDVYIDLKTFRPSKAELNDISARVRTIKECLINHFNYYGDKDGDHYISKTLLTRSSYAFTDMIKHTERKYQTDFYNMFPKTTLEDREQMNSAFYGGLVYHKDISDFKPDDEEVYIDNDEVLHVDGIVIDANSEFPYVMTDRYFPVGKPEKFEGRYTKDIQYPLWVQGFKCKFKLKEQGIPMLPKFLGKGNKSIISNNDLINPDTIIYLCNVDLKHFVHNYDISDVGYFGGWKFQSVFAPFKEFIQGKNEEKIKYQKEGDFISRFLVKTDMVSCYGKFGQKTQRRIKETKFKNGKQYYELGELKSRRESYFPMAIFIASYGRDHLLNNAYKVGKYRILYMDTDSIHTYGKVPKDININDSELGAWKVESTFTKAKYIKDKMYMEVDEQGSALIKASGITTEGKQSIKNISDFKVGMKFTDMYQKEIVQGGCIYIKVDKTIKSEEDNYKEVQQIVIPDSVISIMSIIDNKYNHLSLSEKIKEFDKLCISQDDLNYIMADEYLKDVYETFLEERRLKLDNKYPSIKMYEVEADIWGYLDKIEDETYYKLLMYKLKTNDVYRDVLEYNDNIREYIVNLLKTKI